MILHITNKNYSSWSLRPWLLMRVLEIPFEERLHPLGTDFSFSPTQRVPCLEDGAITVWDSLAITEYLAESHPHVWPADRQARAWARSASAEMHSGFGELRNTCGMNCGVRVQLSGAARARVDPDLARIDALWRDGLERFGGPFLADREFTAVDAFFAPVALRFQSYGIELSPTAKAYAERLLKLPAMQEWVDAGLAETWRDTAHDDELALAGEGISDLRAAPRE